MTCRLATLFAIVLLILPGTGCAARNDPKAERLGIDRDREVKNVNEENENPVSDPISDIKFTCSISKAESEIHVRYSVLNGSGKDIYVLDAYPIVDMESRTASAETKSFYLSYKEPATAHVLKGIPPLPSMPVTVRLMPLGTKVEPSGRLEREFNIPLPLRERSDWYYAPLAPEEYAINSVERIVFDLQIMRSTVEGFEAKPAPYAPEFFIVSGKNTVKQVETLSTRSQLEKLQIFVRKDLFPRI